MGDAMIAGTGHPVAHAAEIFTQWLPSDVGQEPDARVNSR
jgi:hypothetical protein